MINFCKCKFKRTSRGDVSCALAHGSIHLKISGSFLSDKEREDFADEIVRRLNAPAPFNTESLNIVRAPHWSELVTDWRDGRWDPISNGPVDGYRLDGELLHVRGRCANGVISEPMHFAYGGGEEQPPFRGWFVPDGSGHGFYQVDPVEWQPLRAKPEEST